MALSERPEIFLTEAQQAVTGFQTDVRYQQILSIAATMEAPILQDIIAKLNDLILTNPGS